MQANALDHSRRHSQRHSLPVGQEVYLIAPGTDKAIKARIMDISSEGIGIESHHEIIPGTELRLFSLTVSVTIRAVWSKKSSRWGKTMYRAGLRLNKVGPDLARVYAHLLGG